MSHHSVDGFTEAGVAPERPVAPGRASSAWPGFEQSLAIVLGALEEDQYLIVAVKRSPHYVQFSAQGSFGMRSEAVANTYLDGACRLDADQVAELDALGWRRPSSDAETPPVADPDGSPNHFVDWPHPAPHAAVAKLAVDTLRSVYRVGHPGWLEYTAFDADGNALILPTLGLARGLEPVPVAPALDEDPTPVTVVHPQDADELRAEVKSCLRDILDTDGDDIVADDDGDFPVVWGRAVVFVRVLDDAPVIRLVSVLLSDVSLDLSLRDALNDVNRDHRFTRAFWHDGAVLSVADVFASPFVVDHFLHVLREFGGSADELHDELRARFPRAGAGAGAGSGFGGYL